MKNLHYGHCIVGVALAAVLLIAFGVSASTLGVFAVVLACPLMMFVMMRMMMGNQPATHERDDRPIDHDRPR
jgi:choline-glycine betaine transporter